MSMTMFVYYVENGIMNSFEIPILENVIKLQEMIHQELGIPINRQVLLISGGQPLTSDSRICSYAAGTDTNPFYLFVKRDKISAMEFYSPYVDADDEASRLELEEVIKRHLNLAPDFTTVSKRASLARRLEELAKEKLRLCEQCVHEQHLQQQGWAAVVANLEDTLNSFKQVVADAEVVIDEYLNKRKSYLKLLGQFHEDLEILSKIPILPTLLKNRPLYSCQEDSLSAAQEESADSTEVDENKEQTLLDWLNKENMNSSINGIVEECSVGLTGYEEEGLKTTIKEIKETMEIIENPAAREIRGLSGRLATLDEILREFKKIVQEQSDLSQAFQMNCARALTVKDTSVIPDLCESHHQQLSVMYENHRKCIAMKKKIFTAKAELCMNLIKRVEWVTKTENLIADRNKKLLSDQIHLSTLSEHFNFLEQIHEAPAMYLSAVAEVLRRRIFSRSFLVWASDLACQVLTIYNEEVTRRKEFCTDFDKHFIAELFPGMEDLPSSFATEPPPVFDSLLPEIQQEDIDKLLQQLPEFAQYLNIPNMSAITTFFTTRSMLRAAEKADDSKPVEEKLEAVVREAGLDDPLSTAVLKSAETEEADTCPVTIHGLPHLKDLDKGCESETDTEEFEKVGQSPLDLHFDKEIPSPRPGKQDAATLTEDNLQTSHEEREKLKSTTTKLVLLTKQAIQDLRQELDRFKTFFAVEAAMVNEHHSATKSQIEEKISEFNSDHMQALTKIIDEHKVQIENYEASVESLTRQTSLLSDEKIALEDRLAKAENMKQELLEEIRKVNDESQQKLDELKTQIQEMEKEKERAVKEALDQLSRDHKTELENIRSRYKLMTMERSPSDSSLERVGKPDLADTRQSILMQVREEHELDKQKAVSEAISREIEKWQHILDEKIKEMTVKFEQEKELIIQDVAKRISEEKDKQIDTLRERERNLTLECQKHKFTIQQLAESGTESSSLGLQAKVEQLEKEKGALETEIEKLRKEKSDMAVSVAIFEGKVDAATSPVKHSRKERERDSSVKSSSSVAAKPALLNVDSCKIGDTVFIFWDKEHESFRILQNDRCLYFLNSDSLVDLGLLIVDKQPNRFHEVGEVTEKEYCHARKSGNRFKVPKGTKFFRVKAKPAPHYMPKDITRSYHQTSTLQQTTHMWQSQSVAPTGLEFALGGGGSSLPSSPTRSQPMIVEERCETATVAEVLRSDTVGQPKRLRSDRQPSITVVENVDKFKLELSESGIGDDEKNLSLSVDLMDTQPQSDRSVYERITECAEQAEQESTDGVQEDLINFSQPSSMPEVIEEHQPGDVAVAESGHSKQGEETDKDRYKISFNHQRKLEEFYRFLLTRWFTPQKVTV